MTPATTPAITIFVADDHAIIREGLAQLLQLHHGLAVVGTGEDGTASLQQILELRPDVAVLDISMPGLNGIEIAARLRDLEVPTKVVILSMHSSPEYVIRAFAVGARAYLQKESAATEIVAAIRAVHAGRRYLSTRIAAVMADRAGSPSGKSPLELLSAREREVLQLVAEGHSSARIGLLLHLSSKTVDTYRSRLMRKLDLGDVVAVVKFAVQHGLILLE